MIDDYDLLAALKKGTLALQIKKLRALGYIEGRARLPKVTPDGVMAIQMEERKRLEQTWTKAQDVVAYLRRNDDDELADKIEVAARAYVCPECETTEDPFPALTDKGKLVLACSLCNKAPEVDTPFTTTHIRGFRPLKVNLSQL